jgi:hypothetical protein
MANGGEEMAAKECVHKLASEIFYASRLLKPRRSATVWLISSASAGGELAMLPQPRAATAAMTLLVVSFAVLAEGTSVAVPVTHVLCDINSAFQFAALCGFTVLIASYYQKLTRKLNSKWPTGPTRSLFLLVAAGVLFSGAHAGKHGDLGDYYIYDSTFPTDMYFTWNSSSGASGSIQYTPVMAGTAVPDEGNGGMTRRVVLAPGSADCVPFPATTTNHRGQVAGIPFDRDVFVMVLAHIKRPCYWWDYGGEFGTNGTMNADPSGLIWMWSDENDPAAIEANWVPNLHIGKNRKMSYHVGAIARGTGPVGGLTMATEIFNRHRVDITWPGTGPMTDATERAALKEFYQNIDTSAGAFHDHIGGLSLNPRAWGAGQSFIKPEEFVGDDSIDPCSNNGQGNRLFGVTCIGGHVVSLYYEAAVFPVISGFHGISGLTHLRHLVGTMQLNKAAKMTIPCEFGQLPNLKAFVWPYAVGNSPLEFPEDDSCMDGLVSLEEVMIGAYEMNRFPETFLQLPQMRKVSLTRAPLPKLPAALSPEIRVLKLSGVGATGPLPSFRGFSLLEEVFLDRNNLELGEADAFDNCPNLRLIDVSHNALSAEVFNFSGSTKIESIVLSHNSIRGAIPQQWEHLKSCEVLRGSHNLIGGADTTELGEICVCGTGSSLYPIAQMPKLVMYDLSHNRVQWNKPMHCCGIQDFILATVPGAVTSLDFSYNLLVGGTLVGALIPDKWPDMLRVDLSHNFLSSVLSLFNLHCNFDVSYNNILMVDASQAVDCCSAFKFKRQIYSADWRHQMSETKLVENLATYNEYESLNNRSQTIDEAVNGTVDFKGVQFMPRYNSFEQVELPVGSGRYPFSCPTWFVR